MSSWRFYTSSTMQGVVCHPTAILQILPSKNIQGITGHPLWLWNILSILEVLYTSLYISASFCLVCVSIQSLLPSLLQHLCKRHRIGLCKHMQRPSRDGDPHPIPPSPFRTQDHFPGTLGWLAPRTEKSDRSRDRRNLVFTSGGPRFSGSLLLHRGTGESDGGESEGARKPESHGLN